MNATDRPEELRGWNRMEQLLVLDHEKSFRESRAGLNPHQTPYVTYTFYNRHHELPFAQNTFNPSAYLYSRKCLTIINKFKVKQILVLD